MFVIKYDFVLTEDIELGSGCVLEFEGGSISSDGVSAGTITGNNTQIKAADVAIFKNGIVIAGTWICPRIPSDWFGDILTRTNSLGQLVNLSSDNVDNHIIVKPGTYNIDIQTNWTSPLTIKSNTKFELLGTIQLLANNLSNTSVIFIYNADHDPENIEICGNGSIIGDKLTHTGTFGEWSDGIDIKRGRNIRVSGVTISNVFGYGINVGGASPSGNYITQDVTISGCIIKECRAVGIAVIMARSTIIENCHISNIVDTFYHSGATEGKMMECAIDIEPNETFGIDTCIIRNNYIRNKAGISLGTIGYDTVHNVTISNNKIEYSKYYGLDITAGRGVLVEGNNIRWKSLSYTNPDDTDSVTATSCGIKSTLQDQVSLIRNEVIAADNTDTYAVDLKGCVCEGNWFYAYRVNFEGCRCIGNYMNVDRRTFTIKDSYFAENLILSSGSAAGVCIDLINGKLIGNKIYCSGALYCINIPDEGNNIIKDNDFSNTTGNTAYIVTQNNGKIKLTLFADNICDITKAVDASFILDQTIARPYCMEIGITSTRPTLHADYKGFIFFDSTLGKSILWNGSAWVNVDGSSLI